MEKTLQQQYNLIKEGKASKDDFLKSARRVFPEYITALTDYNTAVHILKGKSVLSEGVGGIVTQNPTQPDWFKIFKDNIKENKLEENESYDDMYGVDSEAENESFRNQRKYNQEIDWIKYEVDYVPDDIKVYDSWPEPYRSKALRALEYRKKNFKQMSDYKRDMFKENIKEAVGVKDTKEYGDQNEFEKIDKDVQKDLENQFDNKDPKNIDNLYGQSFLMGYYTEMKDPKNKDKSVDELKAIVAKNMAKDITYYNTEAFMGTKGIGFKTDVIGGGEPVAPKGKYKSSGYGDLPKKK